MSCLALLSYLHWRRSAFSVARGCFNRGAPDEQEQGARILAALHRWQGGLRRPAGADGAGHRQQRRDERGGAAGGGAARDGRRPAARHPRHRQRDQQPAHLWRAPCPRALYPNDSPKPMHGTRDSARLSLIRQGQRPSRRAPRLRALEHRLRSRTLRARRSPLAVLLVCGAALAGPGWTCSAPRPCGSAFAEREPAAHGARGRPGRAGLLFDWLYPAHMPALLCCLEAWADCPEVTTAALKFMGEFVLNKTQRLTFDASSPNGILLFREVSKVPPAPGDSTLTPLLVGVHGAACSRIPYPTQEASKVLPAPGYPTLTLYPACVQGAARTRLPYPTPLSRVQGVPAHPLRDSSNARLQSVCRWGWGGGGWGLNGGGGAPEVLHNGVPAWQGLTCCLGRVAWTCLGQRQALAARAPGVVTQTRSAG